MVVSSDGLRVASFTRFLCYHVAVPKSCTEMEHKFHQNSCFLVLSSQNVTVLISCAIFVLIILIS